MRDDRAVTWRGAAPQGGAAPVVAVLDGCERDLCVPSPHTEAIATLGRGLGRSGAAVLCAGEQSGSSRVLADAALDAGGAVHGVVTGASDPHPRLTSLTVVDDPHRRVEHLLTTCDAAVALPGDLGVLEALAVSYAVRPGRPLGLLDVRGYWTWLTRFAHRTWIDGFTPDDGIDLRLVASAEDVLALAPVEVEAHTHATGA